MPVISGFKNIAMWGGKDSLMGCLRGKSEAKKKDGAFVCKKCGAVSKKKDHLCKPRKIKD